jgi:Flp pilus assembly protein TadD
MPAAEAPQAGEPSQVEGALLATAGTAGAEDNAEGVNHYQQGHWDVAQEHFQKALAANPDLPEAHYNLALALDKLGNHGEATNHFTMALDLAPEDPRIKDSGILKAHVGG